MDHIAKQFTLIDFLGIFLPGSIFVLAVNSCFLDLTVPIIDFFGEHTSVLAVYFVIISYLAGNAVQELGRFAEYAFMKKNMHAPHYSGEKAETIKSTYKMRFHAEYPDDDKRRCKAGKDIFHYVQKENRPERIMIFSSFYTMGRSMTVVLPLVCILVVIHDWSTGTWWKTVIATIPAIILFHSEWIHFEQKCVDEAYMLFITEEEKPMRKKDSNLNN